MMTSGYRRVLSNLAQLATNPKRVFAILTRRLFPIRVILECPEAYHTVGSFTFGRAPRVPLPQIFPSIENLEATIRRAFDRDPNVSVDYHEILALSVIVKHVGARNILEIGTANGNTTLNLAENSPPDASVTTVDLPQNWDGKFAVEVRGHMVNNTMATQVGIQYKNSKYSGKVKQVLCDSAKLCWEEMAVPFDLAFIDGCHTYEYVKIDTENAIKYVRPGGVVIWHDYGMIEDVSKAVDEYRDALKVAVVRGTTLAVGFIP